MNQTGKGKKNVNKSHQNDKKAFLTLSPKGGGEKLRDAQIIKLKGDLGKKKKKTI